MIVNLLIHGLLRASSSRIMAYGSRFHGSRLVAHGSRFKVKKGAQDLDRQTVLAPCGRPGGPWPQEGRNDGVRSRLMESILESDWSRHGTALAFK